MQVLKGTTLAPSAWRQLPEGEALPPAEVPVLVPLARYVAEREVLLGRSGGVGVKLAPADDASLLAGDLAAIALVSIEFPAFNEGRGYSQARLLRERFGFTGEIRATGSVSRDRIRFMQRCGIDAFEFDAGDEARTLAAAEAAFGEISRDAQPSADGGDLLFRQAWRAGAAAASPGP